MLTAAPTLIMPEPPAGHSLGGALATLAAYDITKGCQNVEVACYTYGAPRTGNHAFAR